MTTLIEKCADPDCTQCLCACCLAPDTKLTEWGNESLCDECLDITFQTLERAAEKIQPSWAA
ncbi:MAG: hypothetical protein WA001_04765 [Patescibacteria group bacterium]